MIDIAERFDFDTISFASEWLELPTKKDWQLKILVLTSVLAENNLAYRGTLANMREWLGIKQSTTANKGIQEAIQKLEEKGYIFVKQEGRTYHISITNKGLRNKEIVKIRKQWVTTFKNYKENITDISIDWLQLLRVFVYLYNRKYNNVLTTREIAESLDISIETARKAIKVIEQCNLNGIIFKKQTIKQEVRNEQGEIFTYRNKGTDIAIMVMFKD